MPRLLKQVRPQGALAIQMPAHFRSPVHELMIETAMNPAWQDSMEGCDPRDQGRKTGFLL